MTSRPRISLLPAIVLALALLLAACGEKEEPEATDITSIAPTTTSTTSTTQGTDTGLTVVVQPPKAPAGATVRANVRNDSVAEFTYGAGYELDRAIAGGWEPVKLPPRPVPQIAYVAPPGDSGGTVDVKLPADLQPGLYRVVIARNDPAAGLVAGDVEVTG